MSVIPCARNAKLTKLIIEYSETLKTEAHKIGSHGLDENDFYNSGLFRGAIERVRGQFSATMKPKRDFVRLVLNHMQDKQAIKDWTSSGSENRHDYTITFLSALAQDERERIVKRASEGRRIATAKGVKMGRKPKLTPHQITEAQRRMKAGESCRAIARDMAVHHATISRLA